MSNINYLAGADAALVKLGVTRDWVRQRVRDAVRKGVPVDRMDDFIHNMKDTERRTRQTALTLPSDYVHPDNWSIPNTEPRPLRPDYARDYYDAHADAVGNKANRAWVELRDASRESPVHPLIERDTRSPQRAYQHLRSDKYDLRHSLGDVPESVIEASPFEPGSGRSFTGSPEYANTPLRGRSFENHPRGAYQAKLETVAAEPGRPNTSATNEIHRKRELRKPHRKKWKSIEDADARHEAIVKHENDINESFDKNLPPIDEYAGPYRDADSPAVTKPSNLKRNALLAGAALAVPAAGYAGYRHFKQPNPEQSE